MNLPLTPLRFLDYAERQFRTRPAVVCGALRFTYAQFAQRTRQLAGLLRNAGIKPGDRVALLAVNSHRLLEAYYGVLEAGAILLPLNIRLSAGELTFILNDAGASVLFFDEQFLPVVEAFRTQLTTVQSFYQMEGLPERNWLVPGAYEELLQHATPHRADIASIDEDQVAELFYTSGTSARPKGVMLTHRNIYLHAVHVCIALGGSWGAVELHTIPLFHANGWGVPHYLVMLGGKHVMISHFQPTEVFRLIEAERVESFKAVPTMATVLVNHPDRKKYDLTSLEKIYIGGAAPSPTLIQQVEAAFACECFALYGLTETSPVLSSAQTKPGLEQQGEERYQNQAKAGFAIPGTVLTIVDIKNTPLPHDGVAIGEVVAQGDGIMKGYWGQPKVTGDVMLDGWFYTGDLGTINADGYVQLVDRKKDIIVSGGENVSSLEVENTLLAHDAVLEVAVVPTKHERWGEVPKALVVLKAGWSADEAELIRFARSRLAHYKCPQTIVFLESLPKTGTGKVLKRELRAQHS